MTDIKIVTYTGVGGLASCGQGALSVQETEKITRTEPILKSNST